MIGAGGFVFLFYFCGCIHFDILISLGSQMPTPEIVLEMFSKDEMIILAWLHFLVMDTFAGRYVWMRMLAKERPIHVCKRYA